MKILKAAAVAITLGFLSSSALADSLVPQTGQTRCFDTTGVEIMCGGTGQDGDLQAGVIWPTPRLTDNGNGTVTDHLRILVIPIIGTGFIRSPGLPNATCPMVSL